MKDKYTGHPRGFGFIKFEDLTGTIFSGTAPNSFQILGSLEPSRRSVVVCSLFVNRGGTTSRALRVHVEHRRGRTAVCGILAVSVAA